MWCDDCFTLGQMRHSRTLLVDCSVLQYNNTHMLVVIGVYCFGLFYQLFGCPGCVFVSVFVFVCD